MRKGFTLIELIIVIAIISILVVTVLAVLDPLAQFQKANDARRKSDLSQMQKALESYYQDKGRYPKTRGDPSTNPYYCFQDFFKTPPDVGQYLYYCMGTSWAPYMDVVPSDPTPGHSYQYYASADGQTYYIYARLERGNKDPSVCNGGNRCQSIDDLGLTNLFCTLPGKGNLVCNYEVSSPNTSP